jgi:hypothetical protein
LLKHYLCRYSFNAGPEGNWHGGTSLACMMVGRSRQFSLMCKFVYYHSLSCLITAEDDLQLHDGGNNVAAGRLSMVALAPWSTALGTDNDRHLPALFGI